MAKPLTIFVGSVIGPSTWDWDTCEFLYGTTADDVRMQVEWAGEAPERLHLDIGVGYGGSVREAMAIVTYLRGLGIPISCRVRSLAASAHTLLAMAADPGELVLDEVAIWMVHQPSLEYASGTATDLRNTATYLEGELQTMLALYAGRTGKTTEDLTAALSFDNYMTAQQALAAGWVDRIEPVHAPAIPAATAMARLTRTKAAVARLRTAHSTASTPDSAMSKNQKPAATAAKPANKNLLQKALATIASALNITDEAEASTDDEDTSTATATAVELADGAGSLYCDGDLAVGSVVYSDEAMTTQAAAGDYSLSDGRTVTVDDAATVTAITEAEASTTTDETATDEVQARIDAAVAKAMAPVNASLLAARARAEKAEKALAESRKNVPGGGPPPTHRTGAQNFKPSTTGATSTSQALADKLAAAKK